MLLFIYNAYSPWTANMGRKNMSIYGKVILYIQRSLYGGKEPENDGYYKFSRKELCDRAGVSGTAFDNNKNEILNYFSRSCYLGTYGRYPEYANEMLYTDVEYEKGVFKFKRNPITLKPELQHLWALPPLNDYFTHDSFDEKHRRRGTLQPKYDAFPWSWSEEQIQAEIDRRAKEPVVERKKTYVPYNGYNKKTEEELHIESIRRNGGHHLSRYKEKDITYKMCIAAVETDGMALNIIPKQFITEDIYITACKSNGQMLYNVPMELRTKEMCEIAVSSNGLAIEYVPEDLKTKEMYLLAAKNDPQVMKDMPPEFLDVAFCVDVIKSKGAAVISALPKTHKKGPFYLSLVKEVPEIFKYIPKNGRTSAVCKAVIKSMGYTSTARAVKSNPWMFSLLHKSLYDHDSCMEFINSECFFSFEKKYIYETPIRKFFLLQEDLEKECDIESLLRWKDVCEKVLKHYPYSLKHIDKKILTYEMCFEAVKLCYKTFENVPEEFKTKDICMIAFASEPYFIKEFPEEFVTYELWLEAVKKVDI